MKAHLFCFGVLLLAAVLPAQAQKTIPGQAHTLSGPSGLIRDVHQMERSRLNVKRTGPARAADNESEDQEKSERIRAREQMEYNKTQNLQERSRANVFPFDPSKNVTRPPQPPSSNRLTTQDPAFSFTGNVQDGWIPSDAQGAAGPKYIVVLANGDARILDKLTGNVITDVTLDAFFGDFGGSFDPRIFYDPFGQKFVALALSGANGDCGSVDSKFRLLISNTSDPTGGWYWYELDFDATNAAWMDFARIGFNKDYIVVAGNSICGTPRNSVFALNKSEVYAGASAHYWTWPGIGNFVPAFTYDNSLDRIYLVGVGNANSSGVGYVDSKYISGNPPSLINSTSYGSAPWQPFSNSDAELPAQFGSSVKFGAVNIFGGSMYQNCVYRNGSLWFTHPIFLPATGTTTRSSTQWWQVNPSTGAVQQVGRIDDPSGVVCTFYPSIAVNANSDAVISYCIFSPNYYQSAAYNFRNAGDAAGTVPNSLFYSAGGNINDYGRTGDYGETVVDPNDDNSIWAINQISSQYANFWNTAVALIPAYYGCYTDGTFGNYVWLGNTKNEASNSITSQEMIQPNSNVVYDAGSYIVLSPGFQALEGSKFHAYLNGCGGLAPGIGNNSKDGTAPPITELKPDKGAVSALEAFPNPTTSEVTLAFMLARNQKNVLVEVHNTAGSVVKQRRYNNLAAGKQNLTLNIADLPSGVYNVMIRFEAGNGLTTNVVLAKNEP